MKNKILLTGFLFFSLSSIAVPNNGTHQDLYLGLLDLNAKLTRVSHPWPNSVSEASQAHARSKAKELLIFVRTHDESALKNALEPDLQYLDMCRTNVMNYTQVRGKVLGTVSKVHLDRARSDRDMMLQSLEMCLMPWLLK